LFFGTLPDKKRLEECLSQIGRKFAEVEIIPKQKRNFEF
jgi:hypothetical protein